MYKIDLHIHTYHSGDNETAPEDVVNHAIDIGLDGIAFTEHYYYYLSDYVDDLINFYGNKILIYRGVEFSTLQGHCLVFGVDTDGIISKHANIQNLIAIVTSRGGVVIPSHPFRGFNSLGDKLLEIQGMTAIEGYNGANLRSMNNQAIAVANRLKIPITGGSDAHRAIDVGICYTVFKDKPTRYNLVDLLKKGEYTGYDLRKFAPLSIW
ncbi:MAG: PHP domain-containing protein [Thermodesulfovibrionales bacterium]|nr:PHP domain-containing protein [Thermodesulfovibrionales bacterium]